MVLPKTAESASAIAAAGLLEDKDLHTRLAAILAIADAPASPEVGRLLYKASANSDNYSDRWLSRATFIAATRHKASFLTEYKADAKAVPSNSLPIAPGSAPRSLTGARLDKASLSADWKEMQVPQLGVARSGGLRRRGLVHEDDRRPEPRSDCNGFGRQGQQHRRVVAERPVVVAGPAAGDACRERARPRQRPALRGFGRHAEGRRHTITVRSPTTATTAVSSARPTRCSCRQGRRGSRWRAPGGIASSGRPTRERSTASPANWRRTWRSPTRRPPRRETLSSRWFVGPDVVIEASAASGQMQFDKTELNVAPGQLVELVITNPDTMQHNFVLGQGSLQTIGTAADELARTPNGPAQQHAPSSRCLRPS